MGCSNENKQTAVGENIYIFWDRGAISRIVE